MTSLVVVWLSPCAALHLRSLWVESATGVVDSKGPLAILYFNDASLLSALILGVHSDWANCTNFPGLSDVTHQLLPHTTFKYVCTGDPT